MSVELVRSIYAKWEVGDFSDSSWMHPEIVSVMPMGDSHEGAEAVVAAWADWLGSFEDFRVALADVAADGDHVVSFNRFGGRGRGSGIGLDQMPGAITFSFRDGLVSRLEMHPDPQDALSG